VNFARRRISELNEAFCVCFDFVGKDHEVFAIGRFCRDGQESLFRIAQAERGFDTTTPDPGEPSIACTSKSDT
jgi:hypothetical protein